MSMRPTPLAAAISLSSIEQRDRREILAVHGNGRAACEADFDCRGLRGRFRGRSDPLPHGFVGRVRGIFEHAAFVAEVPDVAVAAVNIFLGLLDGNIVRLRVGDGFFARDDIPFAPGRDDLQFGRRGLWRPARSGLDRCPCPCSRARRRRRRASLASSTWRCARSGRANEVPSRYLCSYTAPARSVGQM